MNIYERNGYTNRLDYLQQLADEKEVDLYTVKSFAHLLGPEEDFDGLVSTLDDIALDFDGGDHYDPLY